MIATLRKNPGRLNPSSASPAHLKCPRCTQALSPTVDNCPACGFSLGVMDDAFGAENVLLDRLTDTASVLTDEARTGIRAALDAFDAAFPQLFAAVYAGALPDQTSLRQFGFWLLNRAAICDLDATRPNENGILLLIDIHGRSAALILGYLPECFLSEWDARGVLHAGARLFAMNRWSAGILKCLHRLSRTLRRRSREAARTPGRIPSTRTPDTPKRPEFIRIRDGHIRSTESPDAATDLPRRRL